MASEHLLASLPSSRGLQARRSEKLPASPSGNLPVHHKALSRCAGDNGGRQEPRGAKEPGKDLLKDLKELKIRAGASRNILFTKTERMKNKQQELMKGCPMEDHLDDDKGMSTKTKSTTKATTELNSGQETKLNSNQEPSQVADPKCCCADPEKKRTNNPTAAPVEMIYSPFSPRNCLCKIGSQKTSRMVFQALNCSAKDCAMCSRTKTLTQLLRDSLNRKYLPSRDTYNAKVITDIVYNENTHIVVAFKDYLIYDDVSEFLKRFYARHESGPRLGKVFDYYQKYSKVFPNYAVIQENKYMFGNIEWKQRAIDERYKGLHEMKKRRPDEEDQDVENKIFTTCFLSDLNKTDSILGRSGAGVPGANDDSFGESSWFKRSTDTQMQSYIKSQESMRKNGHPEKPSRIDCTTNHYEDLNLQELVDKFIMKDSQSFVQQNTVEEAEKPKKETQCAVQIKKGENKRKVLEIAIGAKKVVLQHVPVWDKIKEKVKHARTKSHNNLSTQQQNVNASLKCLESKDVFPLSCKHEAIEQPAQVQSPTADQPAGSKVASRNVHQAASRQHVTEAWTSTQKSTGKFKDHLLSCEELGEEPGTLAQKSLIRPVTARHLGASDVRSKSHGKFCVDPHHRAGAGSAAGLRKQESARATPTAKFESRMKSNERGGRRAEAKTARGSCAKEPPITIKSPKSGGREGKKERRVEKKPAERKTKIKLALQIPSTARASSSCSKPDPQAVATTRHVQVNTNLMLSLGIKSPTAGATTATHFRAATAMALPKSGSKSAAKTIKALLADAAEAQQNLQKQETGFDTKTFSNPAVGRKKGEYCSNRTPDPSHRRFKSSYLNTLNAKIQTQLEENKKLPAPQDDQPEEPPQPNARPPETSLTASRSTGNLRRQTKGARRHAESIHEIVEKKTAAAAAAAAMMAAGEKKKREAKRTSNAGTKWRAGAGSKKDLQI